MCFVCDDLQGEKLGWTAQIGYNLYGSYAVEGQSSPARRKSNPAKPSPSLSGLRVLLP